MAGLLLAMIDLPDIGWPLRRMAGSLERIAGIKPGEGAAEAPTIPSRQRAGREPGRGVGQICCPHHAPRGGRGEYSQASLRRAKGLEPCLSFFSAPC